MMSRTVALAALGAAVTSGAVFGAFALAGSGDDTQPVVQQHFDQFSVSGTPVEDLSAQDEATLQSGGAKSELRKIGTRGASAFYTARASSSGLCFARGPLSTGHISVLVCPSTEVGTAPADFPSDVAPILDMSASIGSTDPAEGRRLLDLTGFAADGVSHVAMIDVNGDLHDTPVVGNIYHAEMPDVTVKAIVAYDSSGREIYHQDGYRG